MPMPAAFDLSNRVAVVTGAGSPDGIGFATAGLLAQLGATVMISGTTDRIEARAGELRAAGFAAVDVRPLVQQGSIGRAEAAERLRGGWISSVHLLPPAEVATAAERLEREAAEGAPPLATRLDLRLLTADRA